MPVTILLVDDHELIRETVRLFLELQEGFVVVGEANNSTSALQMVSQLCPNVVLLDLHMRGGSGLALLRKLAQASTRPRVIILSMYADEAYILRAILSGADGYVIKDDITNHLVRAVRAVAAGGRYLSGSIHNQGIV